MIRGINQTAFLKRISRAKTLLIITHPSFPVSHTAARVLQPWVTQNWARPPKPVRVRRYPALIAAPIVITVPNVLGLTQSAAQSAISAVGLTSSVIASANSTFPIGTISVQSPSGGTIVLIGTSVSLTLSLGPAPPPLAVPNVLGLTQSAAQAAITAQGLTSTVIGSANTSFPVNTIGIQSPLPGTLVLAGSLVSLTLSLGPTSVPVTVPNVLGMDQVSAQNTILSRGLLSVVIGSAATSYPPNTIGIQAPAAGTLVLGGSIVSLTISLGPTVTLPDFTGMALNDAGVLIGQLGLVLGSVIYEDSQYPFPEVPRGTVIGQYPLPGTPINPSILITLFCSSGRVFFPQIVESSSNDPNPVVGSTSFP